MENTTKADEKNVAGAAKKAAAEAAEKNATETAKKVAAEAAGRTAAEAAREQMRKSEEATEKFRPAPVLTPLTVNGRRVFVLRQGQLQALQREVSQQRGMTESLQPQQGGGSPLHFPSPTSVGICPSPASVGINGGSASAGGNFGDGHASAGFSEMNGRAESARIMEEEVTVGSGVLPVESPSSAGMRETFAMASISGSQRSSRSAQLRSKRQRETPEEATERKRRRIC
ncbi:hypothetical protein L596_012977 [Steinernema carpocapsae]|uniref:Uncharacterized protein n=1 Tax=Steinernema carpocapsae TaxID=34508 RepID=A0A4U5NYP8_STECR|nr:hypothetical protein L596_012977 [Steinernema carpocapsae]